jgi:hypothetical protein
LFFDRLAKGDNPFEAANMVREFLFDYTPTGLSKFEKNVVRRGTSFWRWTKNNMMLAGREAVKQPGKFAAIPKTIRAWNEGVVALEGGEPEDYLQKYLRDTSLRIPKALGGGRFSLKNWLPGLEIAELFEGMGEGEPNIPGFYWIMGVANPIVSEAFEQKENRDSFTMRDIHPTAGGEPIYAREKFYGTNLPPRAVHAAKTLFPPLGRVGVFFDDKGTFAQDLGAFLTSRVQQYDRRAEYEKAKWRQRDIESAYRREAEKKRVLARKALADGDEKKAAQYYAEARELMERSRNVPRNP